jgi:hypothetical protein
VKHGYCTFVCPEMYGNISAIIVVAKQVSQ